ncbi:MAG: hypothetical protein NZ954_04170 [Thermofilaceae archaeon]|nr:hypothetical protein [Thermofilaceae archaeon]MCX8180062.1 hypothetical protein [Thermofilaceae archaeon]MDW8003196.1 hypothetical protein [Thermofilaceae archaeon]
MSVSWVPRLVASLGLLTFIYSLTRPWITFQTPMFKLEYRPWDLLEQMAQGKVDLLNRFLELSKEVPEEEHFISLFTLHVAFLVVALLLSFLSIIGNSVGGYATTAAFIVLAAALLIYLAEQMPFLNYIIGSGSLLAIGSAFIYVVGVIVAKSLR